MTDPALKLNVFFAHFPYSGNGGTQSEVPQVRKWEVMTALKMRADPRINWFESKDYADTPIPMTRNQALLEARARGAHLCLMIDSDQNPLRHLGEPWHKPFWDQAFDFIYDNYQRGPRLVFAPYCGPPGGKENVYVFYWESNGSGRADETPFKLEPYSRQQAARMTGIQEAAAGPTGLILIDLRLLRLIEPLGLSQLEVLDRVYDHRMSPEEGVRALKEGYFYYEWENSYAAKKASTEDVTFTRDISLAGISEYGYNPVFCAWDSWIGHLKPWDVGRPEEYSAVQVNATLANAVLRNQRPNEMVLDAAMLNAGDVTIDRLKSQPVSVQPTLERPRNNGHSVVTETGRATFGPWFVHGGMEEQQRQELAALVQFYHRKWHRPLRILEVGSWLGGSAIAMADAVPGEVTVHCVDTWAGTPTDLTGRLAQEAGGSEGVYQEFTKRVAGRLNKTVFPWQGTSVERAAQDWEPFDIIFIDAEHTYEAAKDDILAWWKHLRDDGVMCGHDFETAFFDGVTKAVRELFGEVIEVFGVVSQGKMWHVRKADYPEGPGGGQKQPSQSACEAAV